MLAEWITSLVTPCPPAWRRLGAAREVVATRARYRRCRAAWTPHLEATKAAILDAMRAVPARGKVTVLGSGPLLDVPLADLAGRFEEVVLVDLAHLGAARRVARAFANVRLVAADLGGVLDILATRHLPEAPAAAIPEADADLVVSCNLLGQLPVLPALWLRDHRVPDEAIRRLARGLVDAHLAALAALPGRTLLITETLHELIDGGRVVQAFDPLYGARIGPAEKTWTWDLAPRPEMSRTHDLRATVAATRRPLP